MPPVNDPLREAMKQNAANDSGVLPSETTFDPLADAMRRQRKIEREQQAQTLASSPDAKTAGEAKRLTQGTPTKPSEVISDVEAAKRMVRAKRLLELSDNSPAVAKALEQGDLATAAALVDEQEKVGWFADFFGKLPSRLGVAGTNEAVGGIRAAITDPLEDAVDYVGYAVRAPVQIVGEQLGVRFREDPDEWLERRQSERRETTRQFIDYADATRAANRSDNFWVEAALAGTEFVPVSVVAALTRNPRVAAGIPAAAVAGSSLERARAQGLTGTSAYAYGAVQGGIEYLTEKMPASTLVDAIVNKSPFGRTLMRTLGQEIPGEQIATITQDFVDWGVLPDNRDKTFGDYLAERPEAALATLVGTVSGTGLNVALTRGIGRTAEVSLNMANKAIMARQAKAEGKALRELMEGAGGSAMRESDPEGFARLMRDMAEERGLTSVLLDGKAAREYMQSDDYNPESDPLAPFADDVLDAAAAGGDIAVPIEIALTSMPGTRAWETLKDDMRLTPGADTVREAQAFEEGQEELAAQMDAVVGARQERDGEAQGLRERLVSSLQEKLENDGGYAPYQAKQMAELFAARAINRQSRAGRDAQQAVEDFNVRMVLPPELQRSLAAQEQDMVLAILRGDDKGSTSRARAAAGELTTILERRGWTPSDLTDEQLGEVISKLAEQGASDGRREYRAGDQRGGSGTPRRSEALDGAPRAKGFHGPIEGIVAAAEAYAEQVGIDYRRQAEYVTKETFDEERAARLAQAYEEMQHAPGDPAVAEAYADMMAQTRAQYDVLAEMGYEFYFLDPTSEYAQSPFNALRELRDDQRMGVFSTAEGFGSDETFDPSENPLLTDTGLTWKNAAGEDVPVLANDLFRAVHDAFGHGLEGAGFRYDGEENAWQAHARLYTGAALGAMTTETRGQNSWLNFGPHGVTNRFAPVEETVFADQKTGLMPAWTSTEGKVADMAPIYEQPEQVLDPGEVATSAAEGTSIGWTEQRVDDLLRAFAYPSEPERTKAYAVRMSPDEFLGLTASEQGRALIEERVTQGEEYSGGEIDFDRMRGNSQPIFLIAQVEPERQVLDIDSDDNATITLPEEMRVVGHEGRHRMTMLKRAGVTNVPVVIMLQSNAAPTSDSTTARPQRSAMERVSTGDKPADLEGLEPISYANEERLREVFGSGRELFQRQYEQATIFYSALERAAEAVTTARAPAQQWIATLKKAPGVKQEELEWTGLLDWLEVQEGPVEKAQVIETIQRGGIVVREVVLQPITEDDLDPAHIDEMVYDRDSAFYDNWEPPTYVSEIVVEDEEGEPETKWAVYEAGGWRADDTDYDNEEDAQEASDDLNSEAEREAYEEWEAEERQHVIEVLLENEREYGENGVKWQDYSLSGNDDQSYRELLITLPPGEGGNPNDYVTGTHWDAQEDQGVVAHARFFEARGPNRERILFLDEIQSDWHQMGRDEGYEVEPDQGVVDAITAQKFAAEGRVAKAIVALRDAVGDRGAEYASEQSGRPVSAATLSDSYARYYVTDGPGGKEPELVALLEALRDAKKAQDDAEVLLEVAEAGGDVDAGREMLSSAREADKELADARARVKPVQEEVNSMLRSVVSDIVGRIAARDADLHGSNVRAWAIAAQRLDLTRLNNVERGGLSATDLAFTYEKVQREAEDFDIEMPDALVSAVETLAELDRAAEDAKAKTRLRYSELANLSRRGSIPDAPFKDTWPTLVMKRVTAWAAAEGFDQVAWVKQGENNGGMNDNVEWFYGRNLPNMTNKFLKPYKAKVKPLRVEGRSVAEGASPRMAEVERRIKELRTQTYGVVNAPGPIDALKDKTERARAATENWVAEREQAMAERRADYEKALAQKEAGTPESELEISLTHAENLLTEWQIELDNKKAMLEATSDWDALVPQIEEYRALASEYEEMQRTAPTNLGFEITPELREAAANGFPLFQPDHRDGPRGRILFDGDTADGALIELFQNRNLSTLLHEVSHLWLEELKQDAADPNASEQVKRDYATVLAWFKDNGHEVRDGIIPVGAHEMFARGGERYFREGKAPAVGLQRAFEAFKNWLTAIYKSVTGLRAPITPEIREVFDRLIASDEEIEIAREQQALNALFDSAADAGMSEGEFASYQEQVANARAEASGKVLEKAMKAIRDREKRLYQNRRREVEERVTDAVEGEPLFRALSTLRRDRMDRAWLVETFGEDVFDRLPVRVPPVWQENGSDPEMIAEASGYSTATAMVEALIAANDEQKAAVESGDKRNLKTRTIQTRTDMQMAAEFGDPMTDGQIEAEAIAAVNGERQGEVQASEIKALSRTTGQRPTPYRMAREWARGRVRSGDYATEASPAALQRHQRAITRAGKEAELALASGDHEAALRAKQQQMLSGALLAEAKIANEEIEQARARMKKIADKRTMASVDQDYLEQAHALLEAVDLKERSQASINRQGQWASWVAAQEVEGFDVVVPAEFEARIGTTHWTRLPIEQLLGLDEAVKQIVHIGRFKQRLIDNRDQRDFAAIKREISEQADAVGRKEPKGRFDPTGSDRPLWERIKSGVANADAALLKMEEIFDRLDNGKADGVFNRLIFRPLSDAASRERDMLRDFYSKMRANMETIDDETLKRWNEKITPGWFDIRTGKPDVLTRQQVIAMALNWGNLGNRQRLVDGYGLRESQVEQFLMNTLTESEWQFVQRTWDIINELWPEIAAMERRVNGVEPEKIEATSIQTPFGALRGGYYPAIYDTSKDRRAKGHEELGDDLMSAKTVRATTRASATKERSETVKRPILLDLGVINRHMGEVIHDITHREAIINANRILSDPEVMDEVDAVLGPEYSAQFRPWLKFIANQWAHDRAGNEGWGRFFTKARANATVVGMGFRFTTIMTQLAGFSNSMEYVGAARMTAEIAKASANPVDTFNFVMERSAEMRSRVETLDRDINAELRNLARPSAQRKTADALTSAKRFAFHGIGYMDRVVSIPTWMGGYNRAIESGATEEQAVYEGDKAVRLSQGNAEAKDLAAVSRGTGQWGGALKLLTMFYSYMSAFYSRQRRFMWDGNRALRDRDLAALPGLLSRAFFLFIVPPLLAEFLSGRGPGEDEDAVWWAFRKMVSQMLGPVPVVRDIWEPAWARATDAPSFGYRFTPAQGAVESAINVVGDAGNVVEGEETKRATRNALEFVGYTTGLVPGQFAAAAQFIVDVSEGDQDPEDLSQWMEGLTKGRVSEE